MSQNYRLAPAGRRDNLLMIAVAMILWVFAVWSVSSTLRLSLHPAAFPSDLQRLLAQPPALEQTVPALLMLVLVVATPLLIWNLIAEWDATFRPEAEGLQYETLGIRLCYPWHVMSAIQPHPVTPDEAAVILCWYDPAETISNPLRRWLHRQTHGRQRLIIGAGIERRAELLRVIEEEMARARSRATTDTVHMPAS
ncbi:hypothetical protein [Chloroflexus sp.]|uniref:hypothetical protein n=1 Tax=Chloroflexus sp. TaxID=1904827 RepID=UPI002ADDC1BC|nr:hypothetical protein [Chloroflexus sp.]